MFCSNCGKELTQNTNFCPNCGTKIIHKDVPAEQCKQALPEKTVVAPPATELPSAPSATSSEGTKSFVTTAILSMLPFPCGLHRFYTGRIWSGLIQCFTFGLYLIWSFIDVLRILSNSYKDADNKLLKGYSKGKAALLLLLWITIYGLIISMAINNSNKASEKSASNDADKQAEISSQIQPAEVKKETAPTPEVKNYPKPLPKIEKPYEAPILEGSIYTYPESEKELKKAGFTKTLSKLGLKGIKRANKLIPVAAKKAAMNKKCDAVMNVDISLELSTKDNLVIYVWAKNYTKFYFTEAELAEDGPALSEQEKLAPLLIRHEVLAEEVIKSQLTFPSTYDRHELGVFISRTTASCNEVTIEFSAKNAFGLELTYIATVQFDKNSKVVGFHMQEKK